MFSCRRHITATRQINLSKSQGFPHQGRFLTYCIIIAADDHNGSTKWMPPPPSTSTTTTTTTADELPHCVSRPTELEEESKAESKTPASTECIRFVNTLHHILKLRPPIGGRETTHTTLWGSNTDWLQWLQNSECCWSFQLGLASTSVRMHHIEFSTSLTFLKTLSPPKALFIY